MPAYKHVCDRCALVVDVICKIDERNEPKTCAGRIEPGTTQLAIFAEPQRALKEGIRPCDGTGTLQRPADEVEIAAKMTFAWRP